MKSSTGSVHNGKNKKKTSSAWKFIFTTLKFLLIFIIALGCVAAGITGGAVLGYIKTAEPITDEQLATKISGGTTVIYDSKGNVIQKLTGSDNMDSEPISSKDAPQYLKDAIISIEDERFESNAGIDLQGMIYGGIGFVKSIVTGSNSGTRGGSTITQQVVKNITGNTKRSLERKVQEWYLAIQLNNKLEKWQILELYMNLSYFGNSCTGVQAASRKYFGKPVQELTLAQSALLAGITKYPGTYNPFTESGRKAAKTRQEVILAKMLELGKINQQQYEEAINEDLHYAPKSQSQKVTSVQSYFVDQVISDVRNALMEQLNISRTMANYYIYGGGLEIHTTLDQNIQADMDSVFTDDQYFPLLNKSAQQQGEHPQAAMAVIDAQNGQVRALYGGYGKKEASNTLNRASSSLMKRQPGSSIKPIVVYAPAIDLKKITPATIIDDVPVYMLGGKDSEREYPSNYDNAHDGLTSVRNGLKNSVNVVAARIWRDMLGPDNSVEYLKKVGIDRTNEKYISLVMGGLETGVNPLQMAAAYVPFAHKGLYFEPTTFTEVKDANGKVIIDRRAANFNVAYSEKTAFIMEDMMKEVTKGRDSTYPHSGTAAANVNEKIIGMPVAGKTGTTSSNIDKWFVGYTAYYTAAVWYGYDNNGTEPIKLTTKEYDQAQKIWAAVMAKVHEGLPKKDFTMPAGIVQKKICIYSGKVATPLCEKDPRGDATKMEYFIKGTEPRDDDPCTVHVEAQVCTESKDALGRNLLAGPYCPPDKVVTKVFIQRPTPYVPTKPGEKQPKDIAYELPAGEYCPIHGPSTTITTASGIGLENPPLPATGQNPDSLESSTQDGEGISTGSAIDSNSKRQKN
ncbi:MAG TPA: transglycosylase domain-containing protein [Clostridia bacterium]|nr:transglycosylase domain-containing protein [Clostridia bacterium]